MKHGSTNIKFIKLFISRYFKCTRYTASYKTRLWFWTNILSGIRRRLLWLISKQHTSFRLGIKLELWHCTLRALLK